MQSYDEMLLYSKRRSAIRWPFRVLALVFALAVIAAALGGAWMALRHQDLKAALLALAFAPLAALVGRLAVHALRTGRVTANPRWPFASGSVAVTWLLLAWLVGSYA